MASVKKIPSTAKAGVLGFFLFMIKVIFYLNYKVFGELENIDPSFVSQGPRMTKG